ncbi:MAG: hypothetical protein WCO38_10535 [Verrucomicrobiota bacterium]
MSISYLQKRKRTIPALFLVLFVCVACGDSSAVLNSVTPADAIHPTITTGSTVRPTEIIDKSTNTPIPANQALPAPISSPISTLAVFSLGTSRNGEDKLDPANITNIFTPDEGIFVFAQYGGANIGIDTLEFNITVNEAQSQGKFFPLEQTDGILIVPLSKIIDHTGIGKYALEIRFQNKPVLSRFEFQVMHRPLPSVLVVAQVSPPRVNQKPGVVPVTPTIVIRPPLTPIPPTSTRGGIGNMPCKSYAEGRKRECNSGVVPPTSTPAAPPLTFVPEPSPTDVSIPPVVIVPTSTPNAPRTVTPAAIVPPKSTSIPPTPVVAVVPTNTPVVAVVPATNTSVVVVPPTNTSVIVVPPTNTPALVPPPPTAAPPPTLIPVER